MIYLNFPIGSNFGWGVCGKYVARELAALTPLTLITDQLHADMVGDEFELHRLRQLLPPSVDLRELQTSPLLQAIAGSHMAPIRADVRSEKTVGYSFFEENRLKPEAIETARQHFRIVTTGSNWCTNALKQHGLSDVETVIQGIDPAIFFPHDPPQRLYGEKFLVFSGGKFELRKGQDLVIRAFKVLQDRHPDAMLVTAWFNQWGFSWQTMRGSPHIHFAPTTDQYFDALNQILHDNGVDPRRCINMAPRANQIFANIYRNTDVGVFPNRCEGGTNLVLMEYMACGRPVIATDSTGHADVVNRNNALVIESPGTKTIVDPQGVAVADWPEPDLEQTIEHLEYAYQQRDRMRQLGERGAADMAKLTWAQTAKRFLEVLQRV